MLCQVYQASGRHFPAGTTPIGSFIFIEFLKSFFSQEPFAKSLQMNYFFLSIGFLVYLEYAIL